MRSAVVLALIVTFAPVSLEARPMTDAAIRQAIIQDSLAAYHGNCPCPYNTDRRGHSCGGRSAYSRPGGYAPLCYAKDVSDEAVKAYRRSHIE
jgi:hypothetical protein